MAEGFERTGSFEEIINKFTIDGHDQFIDSIKNRDPKACDLELLNKMQNARHHDLKFEAFDISPLNIGEGERILKMELIERMTLEELGYKTTNKRKMNIKEVAQLMANQLSAAATERERLRRKEKN